MDNFLLYCLASREVARLKVKIVGCDNKRVGCDNFSRSKPVTTRYVAFAMIGLTPTIVSLIASVLISA